MRKWLCGAEKGAIIFLKVRGFRGALQATPGGKERRFPTLFP